MADQWIEGIQKGVQYRREALEFLERAREQFPISSASHAGTVARLWLAADEMDKVCWEALERLNTGLLGGASEIEITRGASMQPLGQMDAEQDPSLPLMDPQGGMGPTERLTYECSWSLLWDDGRHGVALRLLVDPQSGEMRVLAQGRSYPEHRDLEQPLENAQLLEVLAELYVAEATVDEEMEAADRTFIELQERERAMLAAAESEITAGEEPTP